MADFIKLAENVLSEYELEYELNETMDNTICIYDLDEKGETYSFFLKISEKGVSTLMCIIDEYDDKGERSSLYEKLNDINGRYTHMKAFLDSEGNIWTTHEFILPNDTESARVILLATIIAYSQATSSCMSII